MSEIEVACPMPGAAPEGRFPLLGKNPSEHPGADEPRDKHGALGPRTEKLVEASIQWAEKIIEKGDGMFGE